MFYAGNQIITRGLPTAEGTRFADRIFRFGVQMLPTNLPLLSIPDQTLGRGDEFIALDRDQAEWMATVGKAWFREVAECSWECHSEAAYAALLRALSPLVTVEPPPAPKRSRSGRSRT